MLESSDATDAPDAAVIRVAPEMCTRMSAHMILLLQYSESSFHRLTVKVK
jgi:hypothetical protein